MLKINEIYQSIQGESSYAGLPCVFVRLTGCNLRCSWCDTEYAFYEGKSMAVEDVVREVDHFKNNLVEITGGEPLMQKDVYLLMNRLLEKGYKVMLETGGSMSLQNVPEEVVKIMDLKCPGSGEENNNDYGNLELLTPNDEVKFVILDKNDYLWSKDILNRHQVHKKAQVLFSPVYDKLSLKDLAEWILEDHLSVRLQTQLHKSIWSKDAIGV
ncbi:MAG: radical SAM protein [Nitrospinota bacterium]|nr:radical SAM protein [Nitrospinota bacterium]